MRKRNTALQIAHRWDWRQGGAVVTEHAALSHKGPIKLLVVET